MDEKFWTLWAGVILGAEGEGENSSENSEGDADENDGDNSEDSDESTEGNEDSTPTAEDFEKLQKALAAERRNNKKLDRENRRLKSSKTAEENEEQQNIETAQNREREALARAEKLAAGLLRRDIDAAIEKVARDMKFLDPEDAIAGVDRTSIESDQDEEDPTDIYINEDTVKAAVKKLAAKKPHYLTRGTDDGEPTGSAFGGNKSKSKKTEDEALKELYPSL